MITGQVRMMGGVASSNLQTLALNSGGHFPPWAFTLLIVYLLVALVFVAVLGQFLRLYMRAIVSGVPIRLIDLIGMRLRKVPMNVVVNCLIMSRRVGLEVSQAEMEAHVLAGGDLVNVIHAMVAAEKMGDPLEWKTATALDLGGRDVLAIVQNGVPRDLASSESRRYMKQVEREAWYGG